MKKAIYMNYLTNLSLTQKQSVYYWSEMPLSGPQSNY